jgi:hypothetical protein
MTKLRAEFSILGHIAVYPVVSQLTFRRNMSPPSSASKNQPSMKGEQNQSKRLAQVSTYMGNRREMEDSESVSFKSPAGQNE